MAHRLLGHEHDALDAVHDGYLKALNALDTCDGRSGFRAWLLRVVANAALDFGRKRRRRDKLRLLSFECGNTRNSGFDEADPAVGLEREDLRKVLDAALAKLGPTKWPRIIRWTPTYCAAGEANSSTASEIAVQRCVSA